MSITETREQINRALEHPGSRLIAGVGPCAPTQEFQQCFVSEGDKLTQLNSTNTGIIPIQTLPVWKPRTNSEDWHGEETTNPIGAMNMINGHSELFANIGMELGLERHVEQYGRLLSFAWFGARNKDIDMKLHAVIAEPTLPIGVKNGLDGEIEHALTEIEILRDARGESEGQIVLLFRGGTNALTPKEWEQKYRSAFEATEGRLIVDIAHGSEMAHDPKGDFQKTILGQIACMNHVIRLAEQGVIPAGIKIEASNTPRVIDPPMHFETALGGIIRFTEQIRATQKYPALAAVRAAQARQHEARILNASFGNISPGYEQYAPKTN